MFFRSICFSAFVHSLLIFLFLFGVSQLGDVKAYQLESDPQYVIINVADFYFVDWDASEASWSAQVKPEVVNKVKEIKATVGTGTDNRKLAWSTLLEYTDFPLEEGEGSLALSDSATFVVQAKRIMEVADEADLPVFMPLNGFQWWNQVPELWNHWDFDGDQTPGCGNDEYDLIDGYAGSEPIYRCKFPLLRDEAYRKRFIDAYDPDNKWNVDWQDYQTPMRLNWRNWGGGGFQLAPPPNLAPHSRNLLSYRDFQQARYTAIVTAIATQANQWQAQGKGYLFAGIGIGTEVSLNASATPADEFTPYGYRAIQDFLCAKDAPTCGAEADWNEQEVVAARQAIINDYLTKLAKIAVNTGLPKQRIYTHVWSEARVEDARYANYFTPSQNLFARPTLSLYGDSQAPLDLPLLAEALEETRQPVWGASEFSTDKTSEAWYRALHNTMANQTNPAKMINIYNWREHVNTPAIGQIVRFLAIETTTESGVSEIIPQSTFADVEIDPKTLNWKLLIEQNQVATQDSATHQRIVITKNIFPTGLLASDEQTLRFDIPTTDRSWIPTNLEPGVYLWFIERENEEKGVIRRSEPRKFVISVPEKPTNKVRLFWYNYWKWWYSLTGDDSF
jgi:hypothetical protein